MRVLGQAMGRRMRHQGVRGAGGTTNWLRYCQRGGYVGEARFLRRSEKSRGGWRDCMRYFRCCSEETTKMAKNRLKNAAKRIGSAIGRADRTAHKVARAGVLAKSELDDISKQVDALKRQLLKTSKKLKKALA